MRINGSCVFLRRVTTEDVGPRYLGWLRDPDVNKYLETRFHPQSYESIYRFVENISKDSSQFLFAICLNGSEEHIGNIKLGPVNLWHRNADISLFIGEKSQWGKGYAAEAIRLLTRHSFSALDLNKLRAGCYGANVGSKRAFEKCGYEVEGVFKDHVIYNGKSMDLITLGITKTSYEAGLVNEQRVERN